MFAVLALTGRSKSKPGMRGILAKTRIGHSICRSQGLQLCLLVVSVCTGPYLFDVPKCSIIVKSLLALARPDLKKVLGQRIQTLQLSVTPAKQLTECPSYQASVRPSWTLHRLCMKHYASQVFQ